MITTRTHGMIDYIVGVALIAAPWLFGFVNFEEFQAATWVPIVIGCTIIGISLMTAYEMSIAKIIPMNVHLMIDFITAIFLIVSPWLFNFYHYVYLPHVLVGMAEIGVIALTKRSHLPLKIAITPMRS